MKAALTRISRASRPPRPTVTSALAAVEAVGTPPSELSMPRVAFSFLLPALLVGFLGFFVLTGTWSTIAKILCLAFVALFFLGLVTNRQARV